MSDPKLIHEIENAEAALRLAMLNGDADALDALIHPDLVFSLPEGARVGKEGDLAAHRSGAIKLSRLEFGERQIVAWDDSAAVIVDVDLAGSFQGQAFSGMFRYTRVWRRQSGHWRVVVGHASSLGR